MTGRKSSTVKALSVHFTINTTDIPDKKIRLTFQESLILIGLLSDSTERGDLDRRVSSYGTLLWEHADFTIKRCGKNNQIKNSTLGLILPLGYKGETAGMLSLSA
jgi:hypothetical protein